MPEDLKHEDGQPAGETVLNSLEIDTIGEILNISMGSAATAISTMLDKQVVISTPTVELRTFNAVDYSTLEPAMLVKINYVEGITGSNVMIFRQKDMQIILNLLMGNDDPPTDDFVFDELSMSAACEVMNQMMGASATALSEFLGRTINISTPDASIVDSESSYKTAVDVEENEEIVAISFQLMIEGVMSSEFVSIMTCQLAKDIVSQVMGQQEQDIEGIEPVGTAVSSPSGPAPSEPQPAQAQAAWTPPMPAEIPQQPPAPIQEPFQAAENAASAAGPAAAPTSGAPAATAYPPYGFPPMEAPPGYPPYYGQQMPAYPYPYPPYGYPPAQTQPAGYPQAQAPGTPAAAAQQQTAQVLKQPVNVQNTQFPRFAPSQTDSPATNGNMDLLMGVSLEVSVEIGKAKRKIKDVLDFGQGTVIELNKQAGAPVDIVVNGRLLAHGDVVVIDDNFGVRITEILGTKELMDSLKEEALS